VGGFLASAMFLLFAVAYVLFRRLAEHVGPWVMPVSGIEKARDD
jgi:hypothetical protein